MADTSSLMNLKTRYICIINFIANIPNFLSKLPNFFLNFIIRFGNITVFCITNQNLVWNFETWKSLLLYKRFIVNFKLTRVSSLMSVTCANPFRVLDGGYAKALLVPNRHDRPRRSVIIFATHHHINLLILLYVIKDI